MEHPNTSASFKPKRHLDRPLTPSNLCHVGNLSHGRGQSCMLASECRTVNDSVCMASFWKVHQTMIPSWNEWRERHSLGLRLKHSGLTVVVIRWCCLSGVVILCGVDSISDVHESWAGQRVCLHNIEFLCIHQMACLVRHVL